MSYCAKCKIHGHQLSNCRKRNPEVEKNQPGETQVKTKDKVAEWKEVRIKKKKKEVEHIYGPDNLYKATVPVEMLITDKQLMVENDEQKEGKSQGKRADIPDMQGNIQNLESPEKPELGGEILEECQAQLGTKSNVMMALFTERGSKRAIERDKRLNGKQKGNKQPVASSETGKDDVSFASKSPNEEYSMLEYQRC